MNIRIILADDHAILRNGIRSLLEKEEGLEVVGEANDGVEAVTLASNLRPDILVMDISMPNLNGIEAARQVVNGGTNCRVIALSMHSSKKFIMEMLRAGASGYLVKDCVQEELVTAIRTVANNKVYLSPSIAGIVAQESITQAAPHKAPEALTLTPRERMTLQLIAEGHTTKQAASQLGVSVKTVETYRQNIMDKLDIRSVAELTKYAIREGLTSLDE